MTLHRLSNFATILLISAQAVYSTEVCTGTDGSCSDESNIDDLGNDFVEIGVENVSEGAEDEINFSASYGIAQKAEGDSYLKTVERIEEVNKYMKEEVFVEEKYAKVRNDCQNRNELCAFWAAIKECDANPKFMLLNCAPSCFTCEHIDFDHRCPRDNFEDIFKPGDLNQMFERIAYGDEFISLNTTVLSRPITSEDNNSEHKDGPWVITIDDFLAEEEVETLIKYGETEGYKISEDVGKIKFDGTYDSKKSTSRTSENSWCQNSCYEDLIVKQAVNKVEKITGIPDENAEHYQLLKYNVGQLYKTHHDFIDHHVERNLGPRILTVFLYLNDVEKGGGTNFPLLNLTVMPKKGRVLIWPSVLDSNLNIKDIRTDHQALPVEEGIKYGANAWLHLRNTKDELEKGCA
mmetsp:Transcript_20165/g.19414  ORF Transcript_20165/g.19414 Transcript_20165/m.19414 type:complete len:406 (-) Transcript_20165:154-1371(-)|eukprot:CAMPEP_0197836284 /NCGR_PEP_ID=MMETSP1437-20131217/28443_1 /TAXON_ID=49252 ORGANISM="Eucampia antarctica, Strain CCMP1452" /NCGR_SAMPLE_ID=MMETSP1437 /ASSEMBLY_ACC=CAM_ASM_001096 /LENGTH=405 /DNA_ID=CAMNT_0043442329 /DNA_START=60 /DNA_END=1277 /DNA_ORIENTATION=+